MKAKENKKRGAKGGETQSEGGIKTFVSEAVRKVVKVAAIVLGIILLLTYYTAYLRPSDAHQLVFVTFAFPYVYILTVVLAVAGAFRRRFWSVFLLLCLSLTFPGIKTLVGYTSSSVIEKYAQDKPERLKILTFNCHYMELAKPEQISAILDQYEADIVCLQEAPPAIAAYIALSKQKYAHQVYNHYADGRLVGNFNSGQCVLSKRPLKLVDVGADAKLGRQVQAMDVELPDEQKLRLYNCHLTSIGLSAGEIQAVNDVAGKKYNDSDVKRELKTTYQKMFRAFLSRQDRVEDLCKVLSKARTNQKIVVCGDFNDTPISYTYKRVTSYLEDSFVDAATGLGRTYNGKLPPLRIDYVFHSSNMKAVAYEEIRRDVSDHFAVFSELAY